MTENRPGDALQRWGDMGVGLRPRKSGERDDWVRRWEAVTILKKCMSCRSREIVRLMGKGVIETPGSHKAREPSPWNRTRPVERMAGSLANARRERLRRATNYP